MPSLPPPEPTDDDCDEGDGDIMLTPLPEDVMAEYARGGKVGGDAADNVEDSFETEFPGLEEVPVGGSPSPSAPPIESGSASASLPHPDEVRTGARASPPRGLKRKRLLIFGALFLFVLCLILFVSLAHRGPPGGGSVQRSPGSGGGETKSVEGRAEAVVNFLTSRGTTSPAALANRTTPQHMAATWIAEIDPAMLPVPTPDDDDRYADKFEQRYVLAIIFYSMGGKLWMDDLYFLSERDECEWNKEFRTNSGRLVSLGVRCDEGFDQGVHQGFAPSDPQSRRVERIWTPWNFNVSGTIPEEMGLLNQLRSIAMAYGSITGSIPGSLGELKNLVELGLSNNFLTGTVPKSFQKLKRLEVLRLDDNALWGKVLTILSSMGRLKDVYLEDNLFGGALSELNVLQLGDLEQLDLSSNSFKGAIPPDFFNHPTLEVLDLHDNGLSGPIPSVSFGDVAGKKGNGPPKLDYVSLHHNDLSGEIPDGLSDLTEMKFLDLSHNKFTGVLSPSLGVLEHLEYLFVGANAHTPGEIPPFIQNLTSLKELSLKSCNRTGKIPDWLGKLGGLYLLDLDGNKLTGEIPASLGNLTDLYILMLNRNKLSGAVPESLGNIKDLEVLLLDGNDLTGSLDFMCPDIPTDADGDGIDWLVADCKEGDSKDAGSPEISCPSSCCTLCCADADADCNDEDWLINNDPIWEHGYGRKRFVFEM